MTALAAHCSKCDRTWCARRMIETLCRPLRKVTFCQRWLRRKCKRCVKMVHGSVKLKGKKDCNERNEYMACTMRARQFILKVRWLELLTSALEKQNAIYTLNEQTGLIREA
jgi:hypothetical protein